MLLGSPICQLKPGSLAERCYGTTEIRERHRHRYEFNQAYEQTLTVIGADRSTVMQGHNQRNGSIVGITFWDGNGIAAA